jgi:UDP-N-acetylmuramyl tripeptide synthase
MADIGDPTIEALSPRARIAVTAGRVASALSRRAGKGSGAVIGGRVALRVAPGLLHDLADHLDVVLISGTNGKTTTTRLVAEALGAAGAVVSNDQGANMPAGIASALGAGRDARFGVIEVDEKYLPMVAKETRPRVVALLNLSRDQLDRAAETRMLAEHWRDHLAGLDCQVVANADDPLVAWAASGSAHVTWIGVGQTWLDDSWSCPRCGGVLNRAELDWSCDQCDFRRPPVSWTLSGDNVLDPDGVRWTIDIQLPGRANRANATTAVAVAAAFDVPAQTALWRMKRVTGVKGRYDVVRYQGRDLRLLLAKNPAGWVETFSLIHPPPAPVVLSVNALSADGTDTSWLWDVDYGRLRERRVFVLGQRRLDLAVRLHVAGVDFTVHDTLAQAVQAAPPGQVEVIANYTAFQRLRTEVGQR